MPKSTSGLSETFFSDPSSASGVIAALHFQRVPKVECPPAAFVSEAFDMTCECKSDGSDEFDPSGGRGESFQGSSSTGPLLLSIQPCIQVGCTKTPHLSNVGTVNLATPCQLLQGLAIDVYIGETGKSIRKEDFASSFKRRWSPQSKANTPVSARSADRRMSRVAAFGITSALGLKSRSRGSMDQHSIGARSKESKCELIAAHRKTEHRSPACQFAGDLEAECQCDVAASGIDN